MSRGLERLTDRHGDGNYLELHSEADRPCDGPDVWRKFEVPRCWRKPLGLIFGKRCGIRREAA